MILFAYDGSPEADHAIAEAGALLGGGQAAHIVYAWEPAAQLSMVALAGVIPEPEPDEQARANDIAEAGARRARSAGFDADAEAVLNPDPAVALERAIERLKPSLVVLGTRGLHGLQRLLKGSVSQHVSSRAHVPVLVIPSR